MLPAPNAMDLVFELLLANLPTLKTKSLSVKAPAVNVKVPAAVQSVGLPDKDKLMSDLLTVVLVDTADAATVTVAAVPELASKLTISALFGGPAPAAPPLLADQFAVEELSHVPLPPTQ
jgi:hypothetical protein